jgi:hypothetical protein
VKTKIVIGACLVCVAAACLAWTPSSSTTLGGGANDQVQPKMSGTTDGGFCMSWFDNATGGYDVRANRFNASGMPMWGANGVLVADRSFSSTVDYSSWVVAGNKFAVTYNDDRLGGDRISCSLLSATGEIEWTVTMPNSTGAFVANPKVCQDSFDNAIYLAWYEGSAAKVQKLDPTTGASQWAASVAIADGTAQTTPADLWPAADATGGVMLSCVRQVGFSGAKTIKAWRISPTGVVGWTAGSTAPSVVFSTGSLQFGNYPNCQSIYGVGYVFCWYTSGPLQSYVQVLNTAGVAQFGVNGAAVTSTTTLNRVSPTFAADGPANRVYVVWPEQVPNTSTYSVAAQSFALNGTGTRLWGESGASLLSPTTLYSADFTAVRCGGGATFAWQSSTAFGQASLYARRLNDDGSNAWSSGAVLVDGASSKSKMVSYRQSAATVVVWSDGATGSADIKGQRIGNDGSVGANPTLPGDVNQDGVINGPDLAFVLAGWGTNNPVADINHDGIVDGFDLTFVLSGWS